MIKIYQALPNPYEMNNPFAYALMDGIKALQKDVVWGWGCEKFWTDQIFNYDVVLFHWPEALLFWGGDKEHSVDDFKSRINVLKLHGIKLACFVHNLESHNITETKKKCYELVYSSADVLFHMGEYSKHVMECKYLQAKHVYIAPHYTYDLVYQNHYTKEQACKLLGLDPLSKYVLVFGTFRKKDERKLVANLACDLKRKNRNVVVLAPSYTYIPKSKIGHKLRVFFLQHWLKLKKNIICKVCETDKVLDAVLPYYYAAADVCFIQRTQILNSGNVPMAFLMGKVVAGPNVGNVGELLKIMGNPLFDIDDRNSVYNSVIKAFDLAKEYKGSWNHDYAMKHFSTKIFCQNLYDALSMFVRGT